MTDKQVIAAGKTKRVYVDEDTNFVILEAIDRLTAGDAAKVAKIGSIGSEKTTQCANIFRLFEDAGIPTAFVDQAGPIQLRCHAVEMLPLEFVLRRIAHGSFLKRNPELSSGHRFEKPITEIFHKACFLTPPLVEKVTHMSENEARDRYLRDDGWPEGIYTDPYVIVDGDLWEIHKPKTPVQGEPILRIPAELPKSDIDHIWTELLKPAFALLEEKLTNVEDENAPIALVDIKFEVGKRVDTGAFVIADVVDNDSWRIWPKGDASAQLDKQGFREGDALDKVLMNYQIVTELTNKF